MKSVKQRDFQCSSHFSSSRACIWHLQLHRGSGYTRSCPLEPRRCHLCWGHPKWPQRSASSRIIPQSHVSGTPRSCPRRRQGKGSMGDFQIPLNPWEKSVPGEKSALGSLQQNPPLILLSKAGLLYSKETKFSSWLSLQR